MSNKARQLVKVIKTANSTIFSRYGIALIIFTAVLAGSTFLAAPKSYADVIDGSCPTQVVWNWQATHYYWRGDKFCVNDPKGSGLHITWQSNGDLVAYSRYGTQLWHSNTIDSPKDEYHSGIWLELTASGTIAVFNNTSDAIWTNNAYKQIFAYGTYQLTINAVNDGGYGYMNEQESNTNNTVQKDIWRQAFSL